MHKLIVISVHAFAFGFFASALFMWRRGFPYGDENFRTIITWGIKINQASCLAIIVGVADSKIVKHNKLSNLTRCRNILSAYFTTKVNAIVFLRLHVSCDVEVDLT